MRNSFNCLLGVFTQMCISFDTPVSLGAYLRVKYEEYESLAEMAIDPGDYLQSDRFDLDYQIVNYLRKNGELPTGVDTEAKALQNFENSEVTCFNTNVRLTTRRDSASSATASVLHMAQRKISSVLGPYDHSDWHKYCKWGPGATYSLSGMMANLHDKLTECSMTVTPSALPYLQTVMSVDLAWLAARGIPATGQCIPLKSNFLCVPGSRVTTVPKDAKKDRTIAIEPTGNTFLQGGVGVFIRKRLRRFGVNLNDQSINQKLARDALHLGLATVDLSAASDTISVELVRDLLPLDWVQLLENLRSPSYTLDGSSWKLFEKHSSMGNGYTFELESLIFWALSVSVMEYMGVRGPLHVYGDDIILPNICYDLLREVFAYTGFEVNHEKSYASGLFYESCGVHYFNGADVTPCYQKTGIDSLADYYSACNRLSRKALRSGGQLCLDRRYLKAFKAARRLRVAKHFVPLEYEGDEGLAVPTFEYRQRVVRYHNWKAVSRVLRTKVRNKDIPTDAAYLSLALRNQAGGCELTVLVKASGRVGHTPLKAPVRGRSRSYTTTSTFCYRNSWFVWA